LNIFGFSLHHLLFTLALVAWEGEKWRGRCVQHARRDYRRDILSILLADIVPSVRFIDAGGIEKVATACTIEKKMQVWSRIECEKSKIAGNDLRKVDKMLGEPYATHAACSLQGALS
jgi:hypothetical protein